MHNHFFLLVLWQNDDDYDWLTALYPRHGKTAPELSETLTLIILPHKHTQPSLLREPEGHGWTKHKESTLPLYSPNSGFDDALIQPAQHGLSVVKELF